MGYSKYTKLIFSFNIHANMSSLMTQKFMENSNSFEISKPVIVFFIALSIVITSFLSFKKIYSNNKEI